MSRDDEQRLERARRYLAKVPGAIFKQGGNIQTFKAALAIAGFDLRPDDALRLMQEYNARCSPPWGEKDLARKLDDAHTKARLPVGRFVNGDARRGGWERLPAPRPKPEPVPVQMPEPVPVPSAPISAADAIRHLFHPGELLRVVREARQDGDGAWKPASKGAFMDRDELAGLLDKGALRENPRAGAWLGINPQMDKSAGDAGCACFRYLLLESDTGAPEQQLAVIQATGLPVSAVIDSGGKSLHAWVKVDAPALEEYRRRVARVYELPLVRGFDPANKNPGRLTRLPGARRGDRVQRVVCLGMGAASWEQWEAENPQPQDDGDAGQVDAEPDAWPFVCLGYNEGHAWLMPLDTRQPQVLSFEKLTSKAALMGIHGDGGWWAAAFPGEKGAPDWSIAGLKIRQRCVAAGLYEASSQRFRGRGVWEDAGCFVANLGTPSLLVDGSHAPSGWRSPSGHFYLPGTQLAIATEPLDDATAQLFLKLLAVCVRDESAGRLLAGFAFNGFLLGTMDARPSVWLAGERESGKTYALELVARALGAWGFPVSAGTTEAGLRQSVGKGDALPFLYDEAESDDARGQDRMQQVLAFLRAGYDGEGQTIAKGGQGGTATAYRARTCCLLASINPQLDRGRDGSRFALLELRPCPANERAQRNAETARLRALTVDAPSFSARLAARAVALAGVRCRNASKIGAALQALDSRQQKKWGQLLAGAVALEHGRELTDDEAAAVAQAFDPSRYSGEQTSDAAALLERILTSLVDDGLGTRRTVGELLRYLRDDDEAQARDKERDALARVGVKLNDDRGLTIATGHAELLKLLKDDPWRGNAQRVARDLKALPDAVHKNAQQKVRVGAWTGAGVILPPATLDDCLREANPF